MQFDLTSGASTFSVSHARYATDTGAITWDLYYSTDGGITWTKISPAYPAGVAAVTVSSVCGQSTMIVVEGDGSVTTVKLS